MISINLSVQIIDIQVKHTKQVYLKQASKIKESKNYKGQAIKHKNECPCSNYTHTKHLTPATTGAILPATLSSNFYVELLTSKSYLQAAL